MVIFRLCDFNNKKDCNSYIKLLQEYIKDPMGDGTPLTTTQEEELLKQLRTHGNSFVVLAAYNAKDVGFATCFEGVSTFRVSPTINIHDFYVNGSCRGQGVGQLLMDEIIRISQEKGCKKVTLEVREDNVVAQSVYHKKGFTEESPKMHFWTKYN